MTGETTAVPTYQTADLQFRTQKPACLSTPRWSLDRPAMAAVPLTDPQRRSSVTRSPGNHRAPEPRIAAVLEY